MSAKGTKNNYKKNEIRVWRSKKLSYICPQLLKQDSRSKNLDLVLVKKKIQNE